MLSLEMAIVLTELTRARRVEGEAPPEDRSMEACRSARSGLLALTAGFCIVGLFVLGLDVYTRKAWSLEPINWHHSSSRGTE